MRQLQVLSNEQVNAETQEIFAALKSSLGMVPNLYAVAANSEVGVKALFGLFSTLGGAGKSFTNKEAAAIALASAQTNSCDYCLAAHTTLGKLAGLTEEQTIGLRTAESDNLKLNTLSEITHSVIANKGQLQTELLNKFYNAGYNEKQLVELVAHIALNIFTNYFNIIAKTPVDFAPAPKLQKAVA